MFKQEFSAGGIVFKKEGERTFILVTQHSGHHGWVFPKGLIDNGESKEAAAIREVREEGGVVAKITHPLKESTYFYQFKGEKIKKTVSYFVMEYVSGDINDHDWEMEAAEWLEKDKVLARLTYPSDKKVLQEALQFLP